MTDVLASIDPALCVRCKAARTLCGISPCPLLARVQSHLPQKAVKSRDLFGSSPPTMFVGRHGYPNVSVGPMLPPEHLENDAARRLDDPASWLDDMTIPDVVGMRSSLVRTTHNVRVMDAQMPDRITQMSQELAMAARPVDAEVRLNKIPRFNAATVAEFTAPHGPIATVERATLAENVRIERPVERIVDDTDLRAREGLATLAETGVSGYQLERIFSAGLLGQKRQRRLVPTRWAITATDDTLGQAAIARIRDLPTIDKPTVHFAEHFGNRFHVLLMPRVWSFELVEAWLKGAFWSLGDEIQPAVDWEDHTGRTTYARNTTGGYYATRLPVLEHMERTRLQATAIVVREITDEYTTPLGVWVVRETMRRAMAGKGLVFEDLASAVRHIDRRARFKQWQHHAEFFDRIRTQRSLEHWTTDPTPG